MSKISLDLSSLKSAGVYTIEIDESQRFDNPQITSLRLVAGFSGKGPFNRPVLLTTESQRQKLFGDIDARLEKKGCFFNRAVRTMLDNGPVLALNLLKVDDAYDGPDQVNYASLSLDAGSKNPVVKNPGVTYGEMDYLAETVDADIYETEQGDTIPFVGKTPYSSVFDRSRFWTPSDINLMQVAAAGLGISTTTGHEKSNFLNFANCGTDEISILVYKPEGLTGYDITAKDWYGGKENIPYGWIRPSDYISDYFIRVVAVKGNWTNYPVLSADSTWGNYFDQKGILKDKIMQFGQADGIQFIGSWTGVIIPDFVDRQGNYLYIKDRVNSQSETTGLLMSVNEEAMDVISYDLNGMDLATGDELGRGAWIYDYDANSEGDSDAGESEIGENGFLIDMVGHGFQNGLRKKTDTKELTEKFPSFIFDGSTGTLDSSVWYLDDAQLTEDERKQVEAIVKVVAFAEEDHTYGGTGTKKIGEDKKGDQLRLYGVYDASTNRRLDSDYSYVAMSQSAYNGFVKAQNSGTKVAEVTNALKGLKIYSADSEASTGTVQQIEPDVSNYIIKDDLADNTKYNDISVYYGSYASYSKEKKSIFNFEVAAGDVAAEVYDGDIINIEDAKPVQMGDYMVYEFTNNATTYGLDASTMDKFYIDEENGNPAVYGFAFLSYDYTSETSEDVVRNIRKAYYFNGKANTARSTDAVTLEDTDLFNGNNPVSDDALNMFIIADDREASRISVGDLVENITFYNNVGDATKYDLIPGMTKVVKKIFVTLTASNEFSYKGKRYTFNASLVTPIQTKAGKRGFWLITTVDPVLINKNGTITRQLAISNDVISHSLRFIPLKGLHISARHKPGYDANGRLSVNEGIKKIYSVLEDEGIHRGLCNENMVDYRYIVDSMSYGIDDEMGGKVYLTRLAQDRGKTTALLNAPSKKQFEMSSDPVFCDSYDATAYVRPAFSTKYIPEGGNTDMYNTHLFTLPTEDDGSKFGAAFYPHLIYRDHGTRILVPPAADISNVFARKFQGGDPYTVCAGYQGGIIRNADVVGVEYDVDKVDRDYLEPFGINSIIRENGNIMIYANQTLFQNYKSDFNKLSTRENLNTLEIACHNITKMYAFSYNTPQVRASIVQALTPVFETMKQSQALLSYTIKCDAENNTVDVQDAGVILIDYELILPGVGEKVVNRFTIKRRSELVE